MSKEPVLPEQAAAGPEPAQVQPTGIEGNPRIIPRSQHPISRNDISPEALRVLNRLDHMGYKAYLVGGGVRDLYLGKEPKDYDVGTDAKPSRLKKIFANCRIIGRRFRIAHVYFPGNKIIEVATFRRGEVHAIQKASGVVLIDNQYGTPEEDARRRDLTINGLFYDIASFSIIDYVGGVDDLDRRLIRTIRDPDGSFREDPVRMVRALRHASRTGFHVEENTLQAIYRNRLELQKANPSRLLEEVFKDLRGGAADTFFKKLAETHLLDTFLPSLAEQVRDRGLDHPLFRRLQVLDRWMGQGKELPNAVLLCLLLHTVLIPYPDSWTGEAPNPPGIWPILQRGFREIGQHLRVSRRDSEQMVQILMSFHKLGGMLRRREISPTYQKKSYLGLALEFLEAELESRGEPVDLLREWREIHVPKLPPAPPRGEFFGEPPRGEGGGRRRRRRRGRGRDFTGEPAPRPQGAPHAAPAADGAPRRPHGQQDPQGEPGRRRRRRRRRGGRRRSESRK